MRTLEVSRRTLFRDLKMLELAGIPYYHEPGRGYRLGDGFFLPPVNLTVPETLGLLLLSKTVGAQGRRPLAGAAVSGIHKLIAMVPEPIRGACIEMMEHVSVDDGAQSVGDDDSRHYAELHRWIDEGRTCRVRYKSPAEAEESTFTFEPYGLHFAARAWYVLGRTDAHDEVRVLKLARIVSMEPTEQRFHRPTGFRVEDKLGRAWQLIPEGKEYQVELEFTPRVAVNVSEVRWHRTQQVTKLPGGGCVVRFEVDGLNEIAWWICGYADQVTVLMPVQLREMVRHMHEAAAERQTRADTPDRAPKIWVREPPAPAGSPSSDDQSESLKEVEMGKGGQPRLGS
ncbi:MAG: transcriptional regulator [Planctomycetes bacterium]|nr:transcriptional regulator [Planctomycetota bacterium]